MSVSPECIISQIMYNNNLSYLTITYSYEKKCLEWTMSNFFNMSLLDWELLVGYF